jgi:type VI secretion system protein ImpL
LAGRYPIDALADEEVSQQVFSEFFAPNGTLNTFFDSYLRPFLSEKEGQLRWRKPIGLRNRSLDTFEEMLAIQSTYFSTEEDRLQLTFYLTPESLSRAASGMTIDFGDSQYQYFHGPLRTRKIVWPKNNGAHTTMTFALASRGTPITVTKHGEWSWFRLMDTGQITAAGDDVLVRFQVNGISTVQRVRPLQGHNPFKSRLVDTFQLPRTL